MTHFSSILRIVLGTAALLLGVAGLFLPFLQGLIFLAIGVLLLAPSVPFLRRLLVRLEKRYPRFGRLLGRARALFERPARDRKS